VRLPRHEARELDCIWVMVVGRDLTVRTTRKTAAITKIGVGKKANKLVWVVRIGWGLRPRLANEIRSGCRTIQRLLSESEDSYGITARAELPQGRADTGLNAGLNVGRRRDAISDSACWVRHNVYRYYLGFLNSGTEGRGLFLALQSHLNVNVILI